MMKAISVGLVAFCGIMTESFVRAGLIGCVMYAALIAIGVCIFCISGRAKS